MKDSPGHKSDRTLHSSEKLRTVKSLPLDPRGMCIPSACISLRGVFPLEHVGGVRGFYQMHTSEVFLCAAGSSSFYPAQPWASPIPHPGLGTPGFLLLAPWCHGVIPSTWRTGAWAEPPSCHPIPLFSAATSPTTIWGSLISLRGEEG